MDINPALIGTIGIFVLLGLMFIGVPIAFSFAFVGLAGSALLIDPSIVFSLMGTTPYKQAANYTWTLLPLFILMGQLAGNAGLTQDAYKSARTWVGHIRGGLAIATTTVATLFAAVCGSALASSMTMTKLAWPEMKRYKYDPALSFGAILCAGTVAALIPPSIPLVIYGMIAEESVGRLFMGGVLPGLVQASCILVTIVVMTSRNHSLAPLGPSTTWREKFREVKGIWSLLLLIFIVMGGIWGGIFTANEAAGIGSVGALTIGLLKKSLNWKSLKTALRETAIMACSMFILIVTLQIFNTFLTLTKMPQQLANFIVLLDLSPMLVLILILVVYMLLGIPLEMPPIFLLTLPIFIPILDSMCIDRVWFGILATLTMSLAAITPPVGAPMFVIHNMVKKDGIKLNTIFKGSWIFCIPTVATIVICLVFPQLSTWLPNTMIG